MVVSNFVLHHGKNELGDLPERCFKIERLQLAFAEKARPLNHLVQKSMKSARKDDRYGCWDFCGSPSESRLDGIAQKISVEWFMTTQPTDVEDRQVPLQWSCDCRLRNGVSRPRWVFPRVDECYDGARATSLSSINLGPSASRLGLPGGCTVAAPFDA